METTFTITLETGITYTYTGTLESLSKHLEHNRNKGTAIQTWSVK